MMRTMPQHFPFTPYPFPYLDGSSSAIRAPLPYDLVPPRSYMEMSGNNFSGTGMPQPGFGFKNPAAQFGQLNPTD